MKLSLFKNLVSLVGAEAFSKLVTFAAFAYLARICGPSGFGIIEWSGSVLMCAGLIIDQGFSAYGAREIARQPTRTGELVAEIVTLRFVLAAASFAAIVTVALLFVRDPSVAKLLLAYGLSLWALPLILTWVFQGHDRMNIVAVTQIIRQSIFAAVVLVLVRAADDVVIVGFAEVAGVTSAAIFSVWMYKRFVKTGRRLRPTLSGRLIREGVPIGISQMFWVTRMFGATLILGLIATAEDTGYFAGAMRILIALHTFVWLYYFNLLPSISRSWTAGRGEFTALIGNSMRTVILGCIGVAAVWIVAAPTVMVLFYGQSFASGGNALRWMAGVWVAAAISGHFRFGLIAAGLQRQEMFTSALGAVVALVLIPVGYLWTGVAGAAAALCVAETLVLFSTAALANRMLFGFPSNGSEPATGYLEGVSGISR